MRLRHGRPPAEYLPCVHTEPRVGRPVMALWASTDVCANKQIRARIVEKTDAMSVPVGLAVARSLGDPGGLSGARRRPARPFRIYYWREGESGRRWLSPGRERRPVDPACGHLDAIAIVDLRGQRPAVAVRGRAVHRQRATGHVAA